MATNDYFGLLGYSSLVIALAFCVVTLFFLAIILLRKRDSTNDTVMFSVYGLPIAIGTAVFCLGWLLVNNAFEYPIVFDTVEKSMPWYQRFSGLWSGQSSSLLFWSFILSIFIVVFYRIAYKKLAYSYSVIISLVLTIGLVFYLIPVIFISNPFEKLWQLADGSLVPSVFAPLNSGLIVPVDGLGMNPSLRHPAMLLHPPSIYIGLIGFFIPFAFALASLAIKDDQHTWIKNIYPVVVLSWIFLTVGMFLGSWWAYTILGWGGYWGWDAVEIAGLLPWLLSFGLIHSIQMQLRGKNFLRWIYIFTGLIVFFILSGILITRSGILESVHAYSAGVMGPVLSALIFLNIGPFLFLFIRNEKIQLLKRGKTKKTVSEKLAGIFNYLILALVFICFIGQTFPLSSQLFTGEKTSWTPAHYELISSPFLLAVLGVTAVFSLSDDRSSRAFANKRGTILLGLIAAALPIFLLFNTRVSIFGALGFWVAGFLILGWISKLIRDLVLKKSILIKFFSFGMALVHLGLGFTALGILGSETLSDQFDITLGLGEGKEVDGVSFFGQSRNLQNAGAGQSIYRFEIMVNETGKKPKALTPDMEYFSKMDLVYARPAIDSNLIKDIQLIMTDWETSSSGKAGFLVNIHPLIIWIWIGGSVMTAGGLIILIHSMIEKRNSI